MMPAWLVVAVKHGATEMIEIMAWDQATVARAVSSLGYTELRSCKKLKLPRNEFVRRRNGQLARAEKCRKGLRVGVAKATLDGGGYGGSLK